LSVSESTLATGNDGNLQEGIGIFEVPPADGVAGFVVGDCFLFFWLEDEGLLLEATNDSLNSLLEMF
jgi:hypothetical protein